MKKFLKSLLVLLTTLNLLFQNQTAQASGIVVVAADQSGSMFYSQNIEVQTEALITAFSNYLLDCNKLQIDYVAWGDYALSPIQADLTNKASLKKFSVAMYEQSKNNLGSTEHWIGIYEADTLFAQSKADIKVLIFVTDGQSSSNENKNLGASIPKGVSVYAISLGDDTVASYVKENIIPPSNGHFYRASNAKELSIVIEEALGMAKTELCIS